MNLEYNVGSKDRNIRISAGIALVIIGLLSSKWLIIIGAILLATGFFSFCPAYKLLGMNTASTTDKLKFEGDSPSQRAAENLEDVKTDARQKADELKDKADDMMDDINKK